MSMIEGWSIGLMVGVPIVIAIAWHFPRFSVYFLGPLLLVLGGGSFIALNKYFFPFQSDGSIAGLIVPAIMWLWLVVSCGLGAILVVTGRARMKRRLVVPTVE